jgi:hypothetical protein
MTIQQQSEPASTYTLPAAPATASPAAPYSPASHPLDRTEAPAEPPPVDHTFDIDWITIGLGLLTVLAVGGLIPFWLAVWFAFNPIAH